MKSRHEPKLIAGAQQYLEPGETAQGGFIAVARGFTKSAAGAGAGIGSGMGAREQGTVANAAEQAGIEIASPMGIMLTDRRLLFLRITTAQGFGIGGNVKELMSSVPLAEVDAIETKKFALRQNVVLKIRGVEIKLENNIVAGVKPVAEAFARLKR